MAETTRGNGPVAVTYVDSEGKTHKRVPERVVGVVVSDKSGKSRTYKLSDLAPAMINGLAASGLGKKLDIFVRNTVKNDEASDVAETADKLFGQIKAGSLYTRGEGKGAASKFDVEKWIDIMSQAAELDKKPLTEKSKNTLRAKLMSVQGRERQGLVMSWQRKIASVNLVIKTMNIQKAKNAVKASTTHVADLF